MERKLKTLENIQKIQTVVIAILVLALGWELFKSPQPSEGPEVIYAKGLVIQDGEGNPRIAMGFPIEEQVRSRKDTLSGMVMLDEQGMDRVHLGPHGGLFLGGQYVDRINNGWSLFFNDPKGEERTGYGFSDDDNSVGLGMDYGGEHGGEAIYLYAAPNIAYMTINADLQEKRAVRDRIVLWHETDKDLSLVKLSDSQRDGRIKLKAEKGGDPRIELVDSLAGE